MFLAYLFLFVPSDTFAAAFSFSHKMHHKKQAAEKASVRFFTTTRVVTPHRGLIYSALGLFIAEDAMVVTLEWI